MGKSSMNFHTNFRSLETHTDKLAKRSGFNCSLLKPLVTSCGNLRAICNYIPLVTPPVITSIGIGQFSNYHRKVWGRHAAPSALHHTFSNRTFGPCDFAHHAPPYSRQEHSCAQGDDKKSQKVSNAYRYILTD